MKIIKWNTSYAIILPKDIVKGFGWEEGKKLKAKIIGKESIEVKPE